MLNKRIVGYRITVLQVCHVQTADTVTSLWEEILYELYLLHSYTCLHQVDVVRSSMPAFGSYMYNTSENHKFVVFYSCLYVCRIARTGC